MGDVLSVCDVMSVDLFQKSEFLEVLLLEGFDSVGQFQRQAKLGDPLQQQLPENGSTSKLLMVPDCGTEMVCSSRSTCQR